MSGVAPVWSLAHRHLDVSEKIDGPDTPIWCVSQDDAPRK